MKKLREQKGGTVLIVLGCLLATAIVIGIAVTAFRWLFPSEKKATSKDEFLVADAGEEAAEGTEAEDAEDADDIDAPTSDVKDGVDYGEANEEDKFTLPNSMKDELSDETRFNVRAVQTASVESLFPDRRFNWESYSRYTKLRREVSGMSDAVAMPLEQTDPELAKDEWLYKMWGDPALLIGFMRMAANDFTFEDGDPLLDYLPDFGVAIDADDAAIERAKRYSFLMAEYGRLRYYPDDNPQKAACAEEMEDLELQGLGVEFWLRAIDGEPDEAEINDLYVSYFTVAYNFIEMFEVVGFQNVYSSVNYYLPVVSNDTQVQLIKNEEYQEQNQPALVFARVNKNGKVMFKWGADQRDSRPLKVQEYAIRKAAAEAAKKKATTTKTTSQPGTTSQPNTNTGGGGSSRTTTTTNDSRTTTTTNTTNTTTNTNTNTNTGGGGGGGSSDGNGSKVQSEASAFNGNANRNSGQELASDGDGTQTAEPAQTTIVTEGSSDSGRRQVTDYDPGYATSSENNGGSATNGSTQSTDTSNRESAGSTDSSGATVDNSIASSAGENGQSAANDSVQQAAAEAATPTQEAQAGFILSDDMGD